MFFAILFTIVNLHITADYVYPAQATLSWNAPTTKADGTPLTNLAGYKVYYGKASRKYSTQIDVGNVLIYQANNLSDNVTYYFAVAAYDTSGNESGYSNEASKKVQSIPKFSLKLKKSGDGKGAVTSLPIGIDCGRDCTENYDLGTSITLTALANEGSIFIGWEGDCSTEIGSTCITTVNENKTILALFYLFPDIVVSSLNVPRGAGLGETIEVMDTTRNKSKNMRADAFVTKYYLSMDKILDGGDTFLGERIVPYIEARGSDSGSIQVAIPSDVPAGKYYIIAYADANNSISERYENNNIKARPIKIGSDLIVNFKVSAASLIAGTSVQITDTVKNKASDKADASAINCCFSTDKIIDAEDDIIGERPVPALKARGSDTGSTDVTIPANISAGTYYIIVKADADDILSELNEANNTRLKSIKVVAN